VARWSVGYDQPHRPGGRTNTFCAAGSAGLHRCEITGCHTITKTRPRDDCEGGAPCKVSPWSRTNPSTTRPGRSGGGRGTALQVVRTQPGAMANRRPILTTSSVMSEVLTSTALVRTGANLAMLVGINIGSNAPRKACPKGTLGPHQDFRVEAMGLEPTNLLTASQALYQLSYAPGLPVNLASPWSERCRIVLSSDPLSSSGPIATILQPKRAQAPLPRMTLATWSAASWST
jgi:hypothetical protein